MAISSLFFLLIGLYVCLHSYRLGLGHFHEPGPGFIFFSTGALLSIFSLIDLMINFLVKKEKHATLKELWSGTKWKNVVIVVIAICIWSYLFNLLGFFLSTFLLMILLFAFIESTRWWIVILAALITISMSYLIFKLWLNIPFPQGFIGI